MEGERGGERRGIGEERKRERGKKGEGLMMSQCKHHIISTHHFLFSLLLFFTFLASCNKFHVGFLEHKV